MNVYELQRALLVIEKECDDIEKTNVVLGNGVIEVENTGQDYTEPVKWIIDDGKIITIKEQSIE